MQSVVSPVTRQHISTYLCCPATRQHISSLHLSCPLPGSPHLSSLSGSYPSSLCCPAAVHLPLLSGSYPSSYAVRLPGSHLFSLAARLLAATHHPLLAIYPAVTHLLLLPVYPSATNISFTRQPSISITKHRSGTSAFVAQVYTMAAVSRCPRGQLLRQGVLNMQRM